MEIAGGVLGLVLVVLAVVLALFWIIFPWMVHSQLNELIESQMRLEALQRAANFTLENIEVIGVNFIHSTIIKVIGVNFIHSTIKAIGVTSVKVIEERPLGSHLYFLHLDPKCLFPTPTKKAEWSVNGIVI
jgi:hypothetical protein